MSDWDFGGAFANTQKKFVDIAGAEQEQSHARQLFPTKLAHEQATTRLNNAQAAVMEQNLEAEKTLAKISQGLKLGDEGTAQSANIMKMAGAAMQAGDSTLASSLVLRASQAHAQETQAEAAAALAKRRQVEQKIKTAQRYNQLMAGVRNERDFAAANMIFESETGEPAPQVAYDPQVVKLLVESSKTMADRLREEHDNEMERIAQARLGNTASYRAKLLDLRERDLERKKEKDRQAKANDGKDVGAPSRIELDSATNLLKKEGKVKGLSAEDQKAAAFDLAARARALRKQNPGLDASEATQRALLEQVAEGFYGVKQAKRVFGIPLGKDTATYGRPGGSPTKPIPVPANPAARKSGTYYQTPKGTLLYLGNGKWQVPEAVSAGGAGDDEEDE